MSEEGKVTTVKEWLYAGMLCQVKHITVMTSESLKQLESVAGRTMPGLSNLVNGWHCGYVHSPIILSDSLVDDIDVHGGVTYIDTQSDTTVYGFDCNHYGDAIAHWDIELVVAETEHMVNEILRLSANE